MTSKQALKTLTGKTNDQPLSQNQPRPLAQQQLAAIKADLHSATTVAELLQNSLDRAYKQIDFLQSRNDVLEQQLHGERQRNAALLDLLEPESDHSK